MSKLRDFEILHRIGAGSFGTVFSARRKKTGKMYVMKKIQLEGTTREEKSSAVKEVKLLASLRSKYVVQYFDSFSENDVLYLVMEWCRKGDLQQYLRKQKKPLPEDEIINIVSQITRGLADIHFARIIHRDVKTANCFICADNRIKIGDLGVARMLGSRSSCARTMVGTPYYFSPELCENKPYKQSSDIWALGCILYELCTLRHPFTARNQGALVYKIMTGKYEALSSKKYSSSIVRLVDNLLQRDPKKRPSAREILRMDLFDDDDSSGEEEEEEKEEELSTTTTTTTPRRPPPPRQKNRVRTRERVRGGRVGKAIKMARERKLGDDGRPVVRRRGVLKKIKQTKRKKKKLFVKEPFEQHLKTTVIRDEDEKDATVDCNDDDDDDDEFKDTFDDCFVDTVKIVDDDDDDHRNDDDDRNDEEEEEEEEEDMSFRNVETEWSIRNADSSIEEDDDDEDDDDEEEKTSSEEETENVNNNQNPPPSKLETATTTLDELQNEVLNDRMRRLRGYIDASRRTCIQMFDNDEKTFQRTYHILKKQKKTALGVLEDHLQHETEMPFSFCASRVESVLMMLSYESQLDETEREILNMYHN